MRVTDRFLKLPVLLAFLAFFSVLFVSTGVSSQDTVGQPKMNDMPLNSAFMYQGQLRDGSELVNAVCDFQFGLWDSDMGGLQSGSIQTSSAVTVSEGAFAVMLNGGGEFGVNAFLGEERWLEIGVRCPTGSGNFDVLSPRQAIAATPYALYGKTAGQVPWSGIVNVPSGFADNADNDTIYMAGTGLLLSGSAFSVNFAGTGAASTAAHSDHNHGGDSWIGSGQYGLQVTNGAVSGYGFNGIASSASGVGVYGYNSANQPGEVGLSGKGVFGVSDSPAGWGVAGFVPSTTGNTIGVEGQSKSSTGVGVEGIATSIAGVNYGIRGSTNSSAGYGVAGANFATTGEAVGVYGTAPNSALGWAGYFSGDVRVVGTLVKSAGAFRIDHPLDPENKYLSHSFVESPDMMNIYNGNATLSTSGEVWVELPEWFEALNRDFRYQLTAIGAPGPNLHIAQQVQQNRFKIAGGESGMLVSWQVTGVRHDPYAEAHPIEVEQEKSSSEQGLYLHPSEWKQPEATGIDFARIQLFQEQVMTVSDTARSAK